MGQGPLPSPGNVVKLSLNWVESGALYYSSHFYVGYSGGPSTAADLNSMCGAATNNWSVGTKTSFSTDIVLASVSALDLSSASGQQGVSNSGVAGNASTEEVEAGAAVHLRFIIGTRYRGGHPGIFLPPGPSGQVVEPASWNASWLSSLASAFQGMVAAVTGGTYSSMTSCHHVAVSWYQGHTPNTDPSVWAPKNVPLYRGTPQVRNVTNIIGTPLIAAQRRRRRSTGA